MASSLVLRSLVRVAGVAALGRVVAPVGAAAGAVAVGVAVAPVGAAAAAAVKSGFRLRRLRRRAVAAAVGGAVAGVAVPGVEVVGVGVVGNLCRRNRFRSSQRAVRTPCIKGKRGPTGTPSHQLARLRWYMKLLEAVIQIL